MLLFFHVIYSIVFLYNTRQSYTDLVISISVIRWPLIGWNIHKSVLYQIYQKAWTGIWTRDVSRRECSLNNCQSSLHGRCLVSSWDGAFQMAFHNITNIAHDRPDKMSLLFCKGKCGIVPPWQSPSGCEWPSNQALPFTAAGLQRTAGLTSEGPASPSPSSGTLQQALEAKWGVSLLKGSLCVDHSPSGGGGLCLVIQVRLISFCSTRRHWADMRPAHGPPHTQKRPATRISNDSFLQRQQVIYQHRMMKTKRHRLNVVDYIPDEFGIYGCATFKNLDPVFIWLNRTHNYSANIAVCKWDGSTNNTIFWLHLTTISSGSQLLIWAGFAGIGAQPRW